MGVTGVTQAVGDGGSGSNGEKVVVACLPVGTGSAKVPSKETFTGVGIRLAS